MFRNYLLTAFRTLLRNRTYALLNMAGLAIGITACILIFLLLRFELSFDNFHADQDRIYRVGTQWNGQDGVGYSGGLPDPAPEALKTDFPQLEAIAPNFIVYNGQITTYNGATPVSRFKEDNGIMFADAAFLRIFNFPLLSGGPVETLNEPGHVLLTQETAEKYYGDWRKALGQTIRLNYDTTALLKVTGVLANAPANTDFPLRAMVSYKTRKPTDNWGGVNSSMQCWIRLPEKMTPASFEKQMPAFSKKYRDPRDVKTVQVLQPLSDFHFDNRFGTITGRFISRDMVRTIALVGIFLLLTACINFVNLATAQAVKRAKEVGVRKVLGGGRGQLIGQFIGETALITLFAMTVSVLLALVLLPKLNDFQQVHISLNLFSDGSLFFFLLALFIAVSLLSGLYPAVVLSGFQPVAAMKSKINTTSVAGLSLRRGLVVLQFVISQVLIIGTLVAVRQLDYFRNAPMGFTREAIVNVPIPEEEAKAAKLSTLSQRLSQIAGVESVSLSFTAPSADANWNTSFRFSDEAEAAPYAVNLKAADAAYLKTYGLRLVAGRMVQEADTAREFVVNETFVKKAGFKKPEDILGKMMGLGRQGTQKPIVGVVKDFHLYSLHQEIDPCVIYTFKERYSVAGIKVSSQNLTQLVDEIRKVWTSTYPDFVFEHRFLDETITRFYESEERLSRLFQIFAGIAIFIGCLGLYGLVAFMAERKTKEVGIRKVLGATVGNIVLLFSKEFVRLVLIAFVIAAPLAGYLMHQWLQNFEYKIPIGAEVFGLAVLISLLIAFLTVGYRSVKAAIANPVKALRSE